MFDALTTAFGTAWTITSHRSVPSSQIAFGAIHAMTHLLRIGFLALLYIFHILLFPHYRSPFVWYFDNKEPSHSPHRGFPSPSAHAVRFLDNRVWRYTLHRESSILWFFHSIVRTSHSMFSQSVAYTHHHPLTTQ